MLDSFVGSCELCADLKNALAANRLANSLLFCAEDGLGRAFLARCLAADYLYPNGGDGARAVINGLAPECITVSGEGASGLISVKRVREVRLNICETAISANGRVVLIPKAHMLNAASANALLKILEEPPEGVLFILCAKSAATVMATIRSRCCIYNIAPPSVAECTKFLLNNLKGVKNAEMLAQIYSGKIGSCMACATDPKRMEILQNAIQLAQMCTENNLYGVLSLLSNYEKDKEIAKELLKDTCQVLSAGIQDIDGLPKPEPQKVQLAVTAIQNTLFYIQQNGNLKLGLNNLAGKITE